MEDGHPFSEDWAPTITPDQMEAATWASLIHEARGILLFNHSFGGSCGSAHVLSDCGAEMRNRFAALTAKIRALAPVLNSQSYEWTAGTGLDTMLKADGGYLYLFAMVGQTGAAGAHTLSLPGSITATAQVLNENRTVDVVGSGLTDTFGDTNTVHIYQIPFGP